MTSFCSDSDPGARIRVPTVRRFRTMHTVFAIGQCAAINCVNLAANTLAEHSGIFRRAAGGAMEFTKVTMAGGFCGFSQMHRS